MFYIRIGLRNIIKNIRKTALTMATLIAGMAALLIFSGNNSYMFKVMRENFINTQFGHFQIYARGYLENGNDYPFDYLISDYKKAAEEFKKIPGVKFIAPRLSFKGLISGDKISTSVMGIAGNPEDEKLMNAPALTNSPFISSGDPSGIVAGDGLLKILSGGIGDSFTIMTSMKGGGINGMDAVVRGIRKGYGEFDQLGKMFVLADIDRVERLLNVGGSAGSLIVMLNRTDDVGKTEPIVRSVCEKLGLEYKRWDQLAVFYKSVKAMYDMDMLIITIIIMAILIFVIANTMSMNLLERIREIGTMRALGTTKMKVALIFLAESALIGIIGSIAGTAFGLLGSVFINSTGGIYHQPNIYAPSGYHTYIVPETRSIAAYILLLTIVAIISAVSTARKASRMAIADTLRWI
jgi:putative ABC transport system permease protein